MIMSNQFNKWSNLVQIKNCYRHELRFSKKMIKGRSWYFGSCLVCNIACDMNTSVSKAYLLTYQCMKRNYKQVVFILQTTDRQVSSCHNLNDCFKLSLVPQFISI